MCAWRCGGCCASLHYHHHRCGVRSVCCVVCSRPNCSTSMVGSKQRHLTLIDQLARVGFFQEGSFKASLKSSPVMSRHVMSRHVTSCHVMSRQVKSSQDKSHRPARQGRLIKRTHALPPAPHPPHPPPAPPAPPRPPAPARRPHLPGPPAAWARSGTTSFMYCSMRPASLASIAPSSW